ncbi:mucin-2-like [Branchiostoma lanceolatum]|uniref:mucin-2-like n=1 Tax=Branchiostoma lanceolatum TaxID=7740 RepID=UPI003453BF3B
MKWILAILLAVAQLTSSAIIINEINADDPGTDYNEFVELHNTGNETVAMDTYTLVLYNGYGNVAYDVIRLTGQSIPAYGYFVIGSRYVDPRPEFVLASSSNLFQNGPDGIALYSGDPSFYTSGMTVTTVGLVDAIVYSRTEGQTATGLTSVLTPGQDVAHENEYFHTWDESLSRCRGTEPFVTSQFVVTYATPGNENSCANRESSTVIPTTSSAPLLLINELNSDDPGTDDTEFIELHNLENRAVSLDNVNVVLFNGYGRNTAYDVIHLSGMSVTSRGYFVIGSANVVPSPDFVLPDERNLLQNGPDAVALYYGSPSDYVVGMSVTADSLLDAIVYSKTAGDSAPGLTSVLTPGRDVVHEDEYMHEEDESLSRCGDTGAFATPQFSVALPSPGGPNRCSSNNGVSNPSFTTLPATTTATETTESSTIIPTANSAPLLVINELNSDDPGTDDTEFIELHNLENSAVSLDNVNVVLFNGYWSSNTAYIVIHLSGMSVTSRGYFVIGSANAVPTPDFVLPAERNLLQNGPDAVALYYGSPSDYVVGMSVTADSLMDAIVYSKTAGDSAPGLTSVLTPGRDVVHEDEYMHEEDESLSRCGDTGAFTTAQFSVAIPSPGGTNNCNTNNDVSTPSFTTTISATTAIASLSTSTATGTTESVTTTNVNEQNPTPELEQTTLIHVHSPTTHQSTSSTPITPATEPITTPDFNQHTSKHEPSTHGTHPTHPVTTPDFHQYTTTSELQSTSLYHEETLTTHLSHSSTPNTPTSHSVTTEDFNERNTTPESEQKTTIRMNAISSTHTPTAEPWPVTTADLNQHTANTESSTPGTFTVHTDTTPDVNQHTTNPVSEDTTHHVTTPDFHPKSTTLGREQTTPQLTTHLGDVTTSDPHVMTNPDTPSKATTTPTTHGVATFTTRPTADPASTRDGTTPKHTSSEPSTSTRFPTDTPNETKPTTEKPLISTKSFEEGRVSAGTNLSMAYAVTALAVIVYTMCLKLGHY